MPRWVPLRLVRGRVPRYGEERFLVDTWVPRLVEGEDLDVMVCVLLNDALRVLVRVERIHEDERYIDAVHFVKVLRRWRLVYGLWNDGTQRPTSICLTDKSRKVIPSRTSRADLGTPPIPMVVPRPPLSFRTTTFSRIERSKLSGSLE